MTELLLLRHSLTAAHKQLLPAPGRACQGGDAQWGLSLQPPLSQFLFKSPHPHFTSACTHICTDTEENITLLNISPSAGRIKQDEKPKLSTLPLAEPRFPVVPCRGVLSQGWHPGLTVHRQTPPLLRLVSHSEECT